MQEFMSYYAEYGAMGVVVALFVYGYIKQGQRADEQADSLEALKVENKGQSQKIDNIEGIILKLLDRWNASDATRDRRHEDMIKEVNDLSDVMMEVKGSVSRINGKH
jgi:hypothetical protein|tara:strand:+ start:183 stop:503 length:321 start_codon:yes stop_codon:yes gene_type:complete